MDLKTIAYAVVVVGLAHAAHQLAASVAHYESLGQTDKGMDSAAGIALVGAVIAFFALLFH